MDSSLIVNAPTKGSHSESDYFESVEKQNFRSLSNTLIILRGFISNHKFLEGPKRKSTIVLTYNYRKVKICLKSLYFS